jgi:hypothetical protein
MDPDGPNAGWANFNVATGALGNKEAGTAATITPLGGGWYRCSITRGFNVAGNGFIIMITSLNDSPTVNPTYTGSGQTMFFWGAQVEGDSDPTSYIPTAAAATTRNMDVLTFDVPGNFVGVSANNSGTMAAEFYLPGTDAGRYQAQLQYSGGGSPLFIYNTKEQALLDSGGGGALTANKVALGTNKAASMWAGTTGINGAVVLNGGVVAIGLLNGMPYPSTGTMRIGTTSIDGQNLYGTIRQIRFYNTKLSNVQLQGLTL